jgi:hypothetical protein
MIRIIAIVAVLLGACSSPTPPPRPDANPVGITCGIGGLVCPIGMVCCAGSMGTCMPSTASCQRKMACDGPEDCNGMECCYTTANGGSSTCAASCGAGTSELCREDTTCPAGNMTCCPFLFGPEASPPYKICTPGCD